MRDDLIHAVRALLRRPAFATTAVLTLAVGIGSATAVYSVVHTVVLRPLPFTEPDRLVVIEPRRVSAPETVTEAVYVDVMAWRDLDGFDDVAAYASSSGRVLSVDGGAERVSGKLVTWNFFSLLGVRPILGRDFTEADGQPGAAQVAIVHEALWRGAFGADPDIIGRAVELDGVTTSVVGVVPASADVPVGDRIWSPVGSAVSPAVLENVGVAFLNPIGRLAPGVSAAAAVEELDRYMEEVVNQRGFGASNAVMASLAPLDVALTGEARAPLYLLLGATLLLVLIACANVANLQLVRALDGQRDAAVRISLGAEPALLVRRALVESAVIAAAGAVLGVLLASTGTAQALRAAPVLLFRAEQVETSVPVLAFSAVLTIAVALAAGAAPAAFAARRSPAALLRARAGAGRRGTTRTLSTLVSTQVALAVTLLVGAGLLGRTFVELHSVDTGFERSGTLSVGVPLHGQDYDDARADRFYEQVLERVEALPGVEAAGGILIRPLETAYGYDYGFTVEGRPVEEQPSYPYSNYQAITPGYFDAMGIELRAGRDVALSDDADAPPVAVIGESMARRFWNEGGAVGSRIKLGPPEADLPWVTIVGVVEDVRQRGMREGRLDLYVPHRQSPWQLSFLAVRASTTPAALVPAIREAVRSVDPGVEIVDAAPMSSMVSAALSRPRFLTLLIGALSAAALLLGAMGLYGVLAYGAVLRSREMGVRMALGATRGDVRALMVRWGFRLTAIGAAAGFGIAYLARGVAEGRMYGIATFDPVTYLGVAVVFSLVSVVASWLPAQRATSVQPSVVLNE